MTPQVQAATLETTNFNWPYSLGSVPHCNSALFGSNQRHRSNKTIFNICSQNITQCHWHASFLKVDRWPQ